MLASKTSFNAPDALLMQALKFSSKDLDANRDGLLTEGQRRSVRRWQIVVSLVMWIMAAFLAYRKPSLPLKDLLGAKGWSSGTIIPVFFWLGIVLLFVWFVFRVQGKTFRALARGKVDSTHGPMKRRMTYGRSTSYYIGTPGKEFTVNHTTYNAFHDGETYTLYYVPEIDYLLSAEHHLQPHQKLYGTDL